MDEVGRASVVSDRFESLGRRHVHADFIVSGHHQQPGDGNSKYRFDGARLLSDNEPTGVASETYFLLVLLLLLLLLCRCSSYIATV